jgi:T4-like virus tail tube protein gp19
MPTSRVTRFSVCLSLGLFAGPTWADAQVPTRSAQPALREPVLQAPGQPTLAPAQPAASPAPAPTPAAEPAPVSAAPPPSGVTPVPAPAAPPATSSSSQAATAAGGKGRGYSAANFSLSLDGGNVPLATVEGGAVVAEVIVVNVGPDNIRKKHVGNIKYEELSFDVGLDAKPVLEWIKSTWEGKQSRKTATVLVSDYSRKVVAERHFTDALITGTTIPTLDGASKDAAYIRVTVDPQEIRELGGSGQDAGYLNKPQQKKWLTSNFRFELGDLPGNRVARIESFTVGQKVAEDQVGEFREVQKQAGTLEFPNLKVTLSAADAEQWAKWHHEFVVNGKNGDDQEKNGAIVFLGPTMKDELGRVNLFNCGIFRFGAAPRESNAYHIATVTADLYCERMEMAMTGK